MEGVVGVLMPGLHDPRCATSMFVDVLSEQGFGYPCVNLHVLIREVVAMVMPEAVLEYFSRDSKTGANEKRTQKRLLEILRQKSKEFLEKQFDGKNYDKGKNYDGSSDDEESGGDADDEAPVSPRRTRRNTKVLMTIQTNGRLEKVTTKSRSKGLL